jgi:transposase
LRLYRHELFDEQFQAELAETYVDSPKGQPPVPPAQLALATILQAYTKVSDDEVIEARNHQVEAGSCPGLLVKAAD